MDQQQIAAPPQPKPPRLCLDDEGAGRMRKRFDAAPFGIPNGHQPIIGSNQRGSSRWVHEPEPIEVAKVKDEADLRLG